MPRPKREFRRVSLFVPTVADDQLAQVLATRARRMGYAPLAADLWREAIQRGLADMLAENVTTPAPVAPPTTDRRKLHGLAAGLKGTASDRRRREGQAP